MNDQFAVSRRRLIRGGALLGTGALVSALPLGRSLARAAEISRSCPVLMFPGASVEVREMAGY